MASKQNKHNKICHDGDLLNNFDKFDLKDLEQKREKYLIEKSVQRTSDIYKTINLPDKFDLPYLSVGYGITAHKNDNPLFRTVNSEYGYFPPNVHSVPTRYYPRGQKFSNLMAKFGMYSDYTLNNSLIR